MTISRRRSAGISESIPKRRQRAEETRRIKVSKIVRGNGDDHPEAAIKHMRDVTALIRARRYDGAAYLAGYVVECTLKTFIYLNNPNWKFPRGQGHNLGILSTAALSLASMPRLRTARYIVGINVGHSIYNSPGGWTETVRYRPEGFIPRRTALVWILEARCYRDAIIKMRLDGVI